MNILDEISILTNNGGTLNIHTVYIDLFSSSFSEKYRPIDNENAGPDILEINISTSVFVKDIFERLSQRLF